MLLKTFLYANDLSIPMTTNLKEHLLSADLCKIYIAIYILPTHERLRVSAKESLPRIED